MRKAHNDLEEFFTLGLGLGYCHRSEPLQVATDTVLLFDSESNSNQSFEQVDGVNRGHIKLVSFLPPDAGNANAAGLTVLRCDRPKLGRDTAVDLGASELDEASACLFFVLRPIVFHAVKITVELEAGLQGMHGIRIEVLRLAHSHG